MPKREFTFRYRVRNWPAYNRALVKRGELTLWFDEEAVAGWRHGGPSDGPGRPKIYADAAIECALVLRTVFHLSLRSTQGFLRSLVELLALNLPVPDYSTVSRRQGTLGVRLPVRDGDEPRHVVVDATGLKVYGAGEWNVSKHRATWRRSWRKLHLGVDEATKEIVAVDLTASNIHDGRRLPDLLSMICGPIGQVSGDRAYDTRACYESVLDHNGIPTIPPRRNARCSRGADSAPWRMVRDATLRAIEEQGRYAWRVSSGCTRQSLAENAVYRFKTLLGGRLSARTLQNQQSEAMTKCAVLNRMAALGLPESERVL